MEIVNPAEHFAILAKIAYMTEKNSAPIAHTLGYTKTKLIDKDGAECLFLENSERIVLAFRGTEPKEFSDIKADLKAWKRESDTDGMVHQGFYDYLERIWDSVVRHINYGDREQKQLYICGHSLGGAMATLASSRLEGRVLACYTYGSPRVGGAEWRDKANFTHHRYVNNNDVVPKVPLWIMGFRHHGEEHYINHYGNIRKLTPWQRTKDALRGRFASWTSGKLFDGARDHSITEYANKLSEK